MPNYPGVANATAQVNAAGSPIVLGVGESAYIFGVLATGATQLPVNDSNVVGEQPTAPQASIAVCLAGPQNGPPMLCIEGLFSAAPGVFEVDIQEADTDADAMYVTPTASAYTVNAVQTPGQNFRVDLSPTGGKFLRVLLKTRTNAVKFACKVTRLA